LHQVGDLFELNVKLRCQKVKRLKYKATQILVHGRSSPCSIMSHVIRYVSDGKNTQVE